MARRDLFGWPLFLALAQASDVASTWLSLKAGVPEQNPLVRALLAHGDFLGFLAIKLALVLALLVLVVVTGRNLRVHRVTWMAVQGLALAFAAVAALNTLGVVLTVF
ncbi:MAG TPA: DUF5658 family protein [Candidatus Dormibacteraeota bacterium]